MDHGAYIKEVVEYQDAALRIVIGELADGWYVVERFAASPNGGFSRRGDCVFKTLSEAGQCAYDFLPKVEEVKMTANHFPHTAKGTFYRVLNFTGYGEDFYTFKDAHEFAMTQFDTPFVHMWVAARVRDNDGEREISRVELSNPLGS